MMKRVSILGSIGVLAGALLATWLGPKFLLWWFEPPADIGINYRPAVEWALSRLVWIQLGGILVGLGSGIAIGFFSKRTTSSR